MYTVHGSKHVCANMGKIVNKILQVAGKPCSLG